MKIIENFKGKAMGYYVTVAAVALYLIAVIMYLIFGIASATFSAGIFVCLLIGFAVGVFALFYDGYFGDYLPFAMIALVTAGLMMLIENSIDDITALFVGMGSYFGNADNVGMRLTIVIMLVIGVITTIVGAFLKKSKEK